MAPGSTKSDICRHRRGRAPKRAMLSQWLLGLALACAMLFAPAAVAAGCMASPGPSQMTSPCEGKHDNQQVTPKQCHCVGACAGEEVAKTHLAARMRSPAAIMPVPDASSLGDALLERETPPPRLS
jgi:hypothetical protein